MKLQNKQDIAVFKGEGKTSLYFLSLEKIAFCDKFALEKGDFSRDGEILLGWKVTLYVAWQGLWSRIFCSRRDIEITQYKNIKFKR